MITRNVLTRLLKADSFLIETVSITGTLALAVKTAPAVPKSIDRADLLPGPVGKTCQA